MRFEDYKKSSHTVDIVVIAYETVETTDIKRSNMQRLKVMLSKRKIEPFEGMFSLPGGFIDYDVTMADAAKSKLKIKTGVDNIYMEQLYTYGDDLYRDPRGRVISTAYIALVDKEKIAISDEDTDWFTISTTRNDDGKIESIKVMDDAFKEVTLAFDHKKILLDALERLRGKILYTDIALNILPDTFTIREIQDVYELIHGKSIPSFRRIITDKIKPTGVKVGGSGYRPSELYTRLK